MIIKNKIKNNNNLLNNFNQKLMKKTKQIMIILY